MGYCYSKGILVQIKNWPFQVGVTLQVHTGWWEDAVIVQFTMAPFGWKQYCRLIVCHEQQSLCTNPHSQVSWTNFIIIVNSSSKYQLQTFVLLTSYITIIISLLFYFLAKYSQISLWACTCMCVCVCTVCESTLSVIIYFFKLWVDLIGSEALLSLFCVFYKWQSQIKKF